MPSTKRIETVERPYVLTFTRLGNSYPLTRDEADRLIANYPATKATRNRVTLRADDGEPCVISAATLGGGPAFIVS